MLAEISYDLIMCDEMAFVEGTFRLPEEGWQVFIFTRSDVTEPLIVSQIWDSGVRGLLIRFPSGWLLNVKIVERLLSGVLGVSEWRVVRGSDSIQLR